MLTLQSKEDSWNVSPSQIVAATGRRNDDKLRAVRREMATVDAEHHLIWIGAAGLNLTGFDEPAALLAAVRSTRTDRQ